MALWALFHSHLPRITTGSKSSDSPLVSIVNTARLVIVNVSAIGVWAAGSGSDLKFVIRKKKETFSEKSENLWKTRHCQKTWFLS